MRDLRSRLRDIVRQDGRPRPAVDDTREDARLKSPSHRTNPAAGVRELTYVPDPDPSAPAQSVARRLGGRRATPEGSCLIIDRLFAADRSHGRRAIEAWAPQPEAPLHLFDPRFEADSKWWRHVVFFDIETTGLSGGAGTLAFLAGCGWFDEEGFRVRQFLLAGPAGEHEMLEALTDVFERASLLVTYNGRTFDVPFMETRWAFHRAASPTDDLAHFDMLPSARRLWRRREQIGDPGGCSLTALERAVLGVHRIGDIAGFDIPSRYFQFLRTGHTAGLEAVLEHNRYDLVSLAAVMAYALWLAREGPEACREACEQIGLGRLYERAGDYPMAVRAFEMAASSTDADIRSQALVHLARRLRRDARYEEAAEAWQEVFDLAAGGRLPLSSLDRVAAEALAVHHEHRLKDLATARRYAEALGRRASGVMRREADRRIQRIERKLERKKETGGGSLKFEIES